MSTTGVQPGTTRGKVRIEPGSKWVRAYLGGEVVADTRRPVLVWEVPYYPAYYFPAADVRLDLLEPDGGVAHSPSRGDGGTFTVRAGGKEARGAATRYEESPIDALRDLIRLDWSSMDAWFEEDEQVFTHPRDPYTRVEILPSSRHVRVEVDGTTVAESTSPRLLFETGLPVRYYLPRTHVRLDLLAPTGSESHCPYKGQAEWWSVRAGDRVHKDLAWSYPTPLPESERIAGLIAFYNEKTDIYVDGVRQERPHTKFA
jgi:uncharacterized protein (DUF427 family)